MLDIIKFKLEGVVRDCFNLDNAKVVLKEIIEEISDYNDENKRKADLHSTFRIIEEYDTLFRTETSKFMSIPQDKHFDRIYQVQEILSICTLLLSYLNTQLKKYNTEPTETRGSTSKALRQLVEAREFYKGEKISWAGILKAESTIVNALTEQVKFRDNFLEVSSEVDN